MSERVRWYNRFAAWLYARLDWLMELALPVWEAEAEADIEQQWKDEAEATWLLREAYNEGRADEARERDLMEPF